MNVQTIPVALLCSCLTGVPAAGLAHQIVILHLDDKTTITVPDATTATKPPRTSEPAQRDGERPNLTPLSLSQVYALAQSLDLTAATKTNPHLVLTKMETARWHGKSLSEDQLRRVFSAMKRILRAADRQQVHIRDQEMLAALVRQLEPDLIPAGAPNIPRLICAGDTSQMLVGKGWQALTSSTPDLPMALACAQVAIDRWTEEANIQQTARQNANECDVTPRPTKPAMDEYFQANWALADVSAALFIRGMVFKQQGDTAKAREVFDTIITRYNCGYIWDPRGWFWRASAGARDELNTLHDK